MFGDTGTGEGAATTLLNGSASVVCYTASLNDSACYDDIVKMQQENGNVSRLKNGVLFVPWMDSSTACGVTNLKNGSSCNIGVVSFSEYCQVSDEHSVRAISVATSNNVTLWDGIYNFLNNTMSFSVFGRIPGWKCLINETASTWNCTRANVNGNGDTASDATARYIIAAYAASVNPLFPTANQTLYRALGDALVVDFVKYDLRYQCTNSTLGNGPICWWQASGGNSSVGGFSWGDFYYSGYNQDSILALYAAANSTGNMTYIAIAQNLTQGYLQLSNWTGSSFRVPPGRSGHIVLTTVGGQANVPVADCDNTCNPDVWDSADAVRAFAWGEAQLVADNLTGIPLLNMSLYLTQWNIAVLSNNNNSLPITYHSNGTFSSSNQSGYFAQGLQSQALIYANQTKYKESLDNAIGHISGSTRTPDSAACFGIYQEAPMMRAMAFGLGRFTAMYTRSSSSSSNATETSFSGSMNATVYSPLNGSVSTINSTYFNVTVWNLNNSNTAVLVNGTLPQTLYNSTFSADPASDGWTMNSWVFSSAEGGIINNTADSGSAAWTQYLNLSNMTNGYNITLNMSLSNFTNAKIFFGTRSGTQDGDRILLERNGNNVNVKHDGGAFGSFTVAMKQYVVVYILVNLSANTLNVSSGGSKWGDSLANSHLTVNGSYIAFVPGQNMSTVNQNSTGWKISDINVTNTGRAFNVTSSTTGNSTMNVTFFWVNGTIIYQQNGTVNGTNIGYNLTYQANGDYSWFITLRSKDGVANYSGLNYTVSAAGPPGSGTITTNVTNVELGTLLNVTAYYSTNVCIDIDAYGYGVNASCGASPLLLPLNITSFRKQTFNDSASRTNLSFNSSSPSNKTVYVVANGKDTALELSMNLFGYRTNNTFPSGVKVYVNNTLAATVGLVLNSSSLNTTTFNDSSSSFVHQFQGASTDIIGYLHIPKNADVTNANVTFGGVLGNSIQETADTVTISANNWTMNYTKPLGANNQSNWAVKYGGDGADPLVYNQTLPGVCWNANNTWLAVRMSGDNNGAFRSSISCYNTTGGWTVINSVSTGTGAGSCGACTFTSTPSSAAYDSDWDTHVFYRTSAGSYVKVSPEDTGADFSRVFEDAMIWNQYPSDLWMEVGTITGSRDWTYSGPLNTTNQTSNFSARINTYLDNCDADSEGYCDVPIYVYSTGGNLSVSNLSVKYNFNINPISLNINIVQAFLNRSNGSTLIPVTFQDAQNGTIEISNLTYRYIGGNSSVNITTHTYDGTYVNSTSVLLVASTWNYSLPRNVRYFEFIPTTPTSKNVSVYGQTPATPFLNITNTGYGWSSFNFSVHANSTDSCVNLSVSSIGNASGKRAINQTWTYTNVSLAPGQSTGIWFYADYGCNQTSWRLWKPRLSFRACGVNTTCSESVI